MVSIFTPRLEYLSYAIELTADQRRRLRAAEKAYRQKREQLDIMDFESEDLTVEQAAKADEILDQVNTSRKALERVQADVLEECAKSLAKTLRGEQA